MTDDKTFDQRFDEAAQTFVDFVENLESGGVELGGDGGTVDRVGVELQKIGIAMTAAFKIHDHDVGFIFVATQAVVNDQGQVATRSNFRSNMPGPIAAGTMAQLVQKIALGTPGVPQVDEVIH